MPTRILRDGILTSERVAKLGWGEGVYFDIACRRIEDAQRQSRLIA